MGVHLRRCARRQIAVRLLVPHQPDQAVGDDAGVLARGLVRFAVGEKGKESHGRGRGIGVDDAGPGATGVAATALIVLEAPIALGRLMACQPLQGQPHGVFRTRLPAAAAGDKSLVAAALAVPRPAQPVRIHVVEIISDAAGAADLDARSRRHDIEGPFAPAQHSRHDQRRAVAAHDELVFLAEVGGNLADGTGPLDVGVRGRLLRQDLRQHHRVAVLETRRRLGGVEHQGAGSGAAGLGLASSIASASSSTITTTLRWPNSSRAESSKR